MNNSDNWSPYIYLKNFRVKDQRENGAYICHTEQYMRLQCYICDHSARPLFSCYIFPYSTRGSAVTITYRAPLKYSNRMHTHAWNTLIEKSLSIPDKRGPDNWGSTVADI